MFLYIVPKFKTSKIHTYRPTQTKQKTLTTQFVSMDFQKTKFQAILAKYFSENDL